MHLWKRIALAMLALAALVTVPETASAQRVVAVSAPRASAPHVPARRAYAQVFVPVAPPPPRVVVVPPAPFPGAVWGAGYYRWDGHRHVWRAGRWHHARQGWHRVPRTWERGERGWYRGGGWVRD
jgi:hypothetical protein